MGFLHQLHLLLWKNVTLKRRGPWVLAFEIFIPLVLFFILLGLRQKKPALPVKEAFYSSAPLTSAGILPVMQSLCPDGQRDQFGFLQYNNSTVTQLLERIQEVVEQNRIFSSDGPDLFSELENLQKHLQNLSSAPSPGDHAHNRTSGFSLSDVLKTPAPSTSSSSQICSSSDLRAPQTDDVIRRRRRGVTPVSSGAKRRHLQVRVTAAGTTEGVLPTFQPSPVSSALCPSGGAAGRSPGSGPRTVGPRTVGPRTVGPRTVGPRTVGPRTVGPRPVGPRPVGPGRLDPGLLDPGLLDRALKDPGAAAQRPALVRIMSRVLGLTEPKDREKETREREEAQLPLWPPPLLAASCRSQSVTCENLADVERLLQDVGLLSGPGPPPAQRSLRQTVYDSESQSVVRGPLVVRQRHLVVRVKIDSKIEFRPGPKKSSMSWPEPAHVSKPN
ncbi:hypothetical protein WMY93_004857 [Mugilogobius chulae]|uniref:ATP-binding cassette sub-family A member 2 n=1 Tax=Mugilogobius chulae TaxID=88201 RepID=A0AAW0PTA8_9GOBI